MCDDRGHDRPPAGRGACPVAASGSLGHQARLVVEVPDPAPDLGRGNEKQPGFVEIDCVGHEGGDPRGDFCQTLTITDIFTGWTETQAVRKKAQT